MAGLVTKINSERLAAGKPALGALGPALYSLAASNPAVFRDVSLLSSLTYTPHLPSSSYTLHARPEEDGCASMRGRESEEGHCPLPRTHALSLALVR